MLYAFTITFFPPNNPVWSLCCAISLIHSALTGTLGWEEVPVWTHIVADGICQAAFTLASVVVKIPVVAACYGLEAHTRALLFIPCEVW